ncbi:fasciclin domain-containing protein [Pararhodonellum marinum]|uniref:fasciclin domain-containing protein n=1 Tax=Pararhodonellum marinum TaxID=2755358 RepID=UPI001E32B2ED|nr:fasciclin domain-containing protein [Pararhodonellum marinum]
MTNLSGKALAFMALAGFTLACSSDDPDPVTPPPVTEDQNIVEIAEESEDFTVLVTALEEADLITPLSGDGPFTVFAPNDAAFTEFLSDNELSPDDLLNNPGLAGILQYHVVGAAVPSSAVEAGPVTTLNDETFYVSVDPDGGIWINGRAQVVNADIEGTNGFIHELDYVIEQPTQNITEIALAANEADTPEFTELVAALTRADLVGLFSGDGSDNYTVFAPTDAAFQALYTDLGVSGVEEIEVEDLTEILSYHVVNARAFSQDLREGAVTTLSGADVNVNLADLQINESGLIPSVLNVHATNGVLHAIDRVLTPPVSTE